MGRGRQGWVACVVLGVLGGCSPRYQDQPRASPVVSVKEQHLSQAVMRRLLNPQPAAYRLGPGDVVAVSIYLHPRLSVPAVTGAVSPEPGAVVSNNGNIELPLLGVVPVDGLTARALRARLVKRYARYLKHPLITVQVDKTRSIRYYLEGEFVNPGLKFSDRPLSVLNAMALGGSVILPAADLRAAYVVQDHHKLPLNLYRLLVEGDLQGDVRLQTGDTVVVPSTTAMRAFVFGAVSHPGPVPFTAGRLTLLQALASAGMNTTSLTNAELRNVRVIRSGGASGQFFVVNARRIMEGRAQPFVLQSGDIVFVPQTGISHWNQALKELLPSLTTVSALLNPFVDIKFLRQ